MIARPESLRLLERAQRLVCLEEVGASDVMQRHEHELINDALDDLVQAWIKEGRSLLDPEYEAIVERRIGGAA